LNARVRVRWKTGAMLAVLCGMALMMAGEALPLRSLLLGGALVIAGGLLCAVVGIASE
jgi:hypothetical protein